MNPRIIINFVVLMASLTLMPMDVLGYEKRPSSRYWHTPDGFQKSFWKNHIECLPFLALGTGNRKDVGKKGESSVPNQVLVRFKKGVSPKAVLARMGAMGLRVQKRIGGSRTYLMVITDGSPVKEVLKKLRAMDEVELAAPNYLTPPPRVRGTIKPAS